jgi:hypothetical protein
MMGYNIVDIASESFDFSMRTYYMRKCCQVSWRLLGQRLRDFRVQPSSKDDCMRTL